MEKKHDKNFKIVFRSFSMMFWLVLFNGMISSYRPWADPFVQGLIIAGIPYIYYTTANMMINENIFKINKANTGKQVFNLIVSSIFLIVIFYLKFRDIGIINSSTFISNNQLNSKFAVVVLFIYYIYMIIIIIINLKKFGKQELH